MKNLIIGIQFLCIAFSSIVIGPMVTGLDVSLSLFACGACTLIYHYFTKRKIPIFFGGCLAVVAGCLEITKDYGLGAFFGASLVCSLLYIVFGLIFYKFNKNIIDKFLPASIRTSVVVLIGFTLLPIAMSNMVAFSSNGDFVWDAFLISFLTSAILIYLSNYSSGLYKSTSIIIAMICGCLFVAFISPEEINLSVLENQPFFSLPWENAMKNDKYALPFVFDINAILILFPLFISVFSQHIGSLFVMQEVMNDKTIVQEEKGLTRSCFALAITNAFSSFFGCLPITDYAEVTGSVIATEEKHPIVIEISAIIAIILSFFTLFTGFISLIPVPVMGAIMFVGFGGIGMTGIKLLTQLVNLDNKRELIVSTVVLSCGIGNLAISFDFGLKFQGIALSVLLGIIVNILLIGLENAEKMEQLHSNADEVLRQIELENAKSKKNT
ncbi:MAG: uracil-xanthine permease family protein [Rickettsiales bacterium]|nr:MAG: uracil-xanthine permease family protein [Rickettsiales bacterium]